MFALESFMIHQVYVEWADMQGCYNYGTMIIHNQTIPTILIMVTIIRVGLNECVESRFPTNLCRYPSKFSQTASLDVTIYW